MRGTRQDVVIFLCRQQAKAITQVTRHFNGGICRSMHNLGSTDGDKLIDWGKTSEEYAKYRPGPPESFYKTLVAEGIGLNNQSILDLGTGTGVLARQFAKQGAVVTGLDISENQIKMATALAKKDNVNATFIVSDANQIALGDRSFDCPAFLLIVLLTQIFRRCFNSETLSRI